MTTPETLILQELYYIYVYHSKMMVSQPLFFKNHIDFSCLLILKVSSLILQSFSLWLKSPKKKVPKPSPEHFPIKEKVLKVS